MDRLSFVVCTPSRGLVNSRTVESVAAILHEADGLGLDYRGWVLSHDLPIPACHETVAERAMATGADFLLWVEDDVIPPPGALRMTVVALLEQDYDVVAIDYPVGAAESAWGCIIRGEGDEILWCGFGCTLIRRRVLETLGRPWFTTDWRYVRVVTGWEAVPVLVPDAQRYGQHDIHFFARARAAGFRIGQVPGVIARHARIEALGAEGTNCGTHRIAIRERIERPWPGPSA